MPSIQEAVDAHSLLRIQPLTQTVLLDYVGGTNPSYVGWAEPGSDTVDGRAAPVWRIAKITWDGNNNPTNIDWAAKAPTLLGDNLYRHIWDDRASLVYS